MRKLSYFCDCCGKPLTDTFPMLVVHHVDVEYGDPVDFDYGPDLCTECCDRILPEILKLVVEKEKKSADPEKEYHTKPAKPADKKKQTKDAAYSRQKINLDLGKIAALRRAGWTVAEIADELRVSQSTIHRNLEKAEEFLRAKEEGLADAIEEDLQEDSGEA